MKNALRWKMAILITAAIAISYFDRQTLPVAIHAIQREIPVSNIQFSHLQAAFLCAYALMYAGSGKLIDLLGNAQRVPAHYGMVVVGVRQPGTGEQRRLSCSRPVFARHGRRRWVSSGNQSDGRMVSGTGALNAQWV